MVDYLIGMFKFNVVSCDDEHFFLQSRNVFAWQISKIKSINQSNC